MDLIQDNALLIIGILFLLIVVLVIYMLYSQSHNKKNGKKSSCTVSNKKYRDISDENKDLRAKYNDVKGKYCKLEKDYNKLNAKYLSTDESYRDSCVTIYKYEQTIKEYKQEISELKRDNEELKKMLEIESDLNVTDKSEVLDSTQKTSEIPLKESTADVSKANIPKSDVQEPKEASEINPKLDSKEESTNETVIERKDESIVEPKKAATNEQKMESSKEKIMYASFPRLAGNSTYFSDLSDNVVDDSYFELKINVPSGKATFKPLDFMRIRNYDPTMYAVSTEGVKANLASTVIGVEPGKAHLEGADWIIDNLAKIKLA